MKKLFILELKPEFQPFYDFNSARVVRAVNAKEARGLANQYVGDEGTVWHDAKKVTCKPLKESGKSQIVLSSYHGV